MSECNCSVCERNKAFEKHLQDVDEKSRSFFMNLYDSFLEIEMDRDYYKVIVDGTWPNADDVIKHVRAKKAQNASTAPNPN